jgi:hypothetical protein
MFVELSTGAETWRAEVAAFTEEEVARVCADWRVLRSLLRNETFYVGCNATSGTGAVLAGPTHRAVAHVRIVPPEQTLCGGLRTNGPFQQECTKLATEVRRTFRWGREGEPAVVWINHMLCRHCAAEWDSDDDEGRAEAEGS